MAKDDERRAKILHLVERYGAFLSLPRLDFDAEGLLALVFDDIEITLSIRALDQVLVMRSALDVSKIDTNAAFFVALHTANGRSLEGGRGCVTVDVNVGGLVWIDAFDPIQLGVEDLHRRLLSGVESIRLWRLELPDLARQQRRPSFAEESGLSILRL